MGMGASKNIWKDVLGMWACVCEEGHAYTKGQANTTKAASRKAKGQVTNIKASRRKRTESQRRMNESVKM
jgi:hypothetical protein